VERGVPIGYGEPRPGCLNVMAIVFLGGRRIKVMVKRNVDYVFRSIVYPEDSIGQRHVRKIKVLIFRDS
jgi:hypothetical protein